MNRPALQSSLVFVLGATLSVWAGLHQREQNRVRVEAQLTTAADSAAADLGGRFQRYEYGLRGARGAVIIGGAGVSRGQFLRYAESRDIDVEFPGARGFGYIARVPQSGEAALVSSARADGAPDFAVRQFAPHNGERFVIKYIEPQARNAEAIGRDMASERVRRDAAIAAMASGKATLTGPITLVQAAGLPMHSMLLLLPVYEGPQNRPNAGRAAAGIGWVFAPLVTDEILASFQQANASYGFTLTDLASKTQIYATDAAGNAVLPSRSRDFDVFNRQWRVTVEALPAFVAGMGLPSPWQMALLIAVMSAVVALALHQVLSTSLRRRSADSARARLAAIVESSQEAIIGSTLDGRITEWNGAAVRMFGYPAHDALGRSMLELIVPFERAREDQRILERIVQGQVVDLTEAVRRHQDGRLLNVEFSASPIKNSRGRVTGVATVLRDISDRRRSQAGLSDLTANLEHQVEQRTAQLQAFSTLQRAILDNAGYAIVATDPDGTITLFNPAAETMLGYASAEVVGKVTPVQFHDPLELSERAHALQQTLDRPIAAGFETLIAKAAHATDVHEWTFVTRGGERIPVLLNVNALRAGNGTITGYLAIAADLREQKQRDAAIEINDRKLRGLFELSPLGIALTDGQGRFIEYNEAFRALTGYDDATLHELNNRGLTPPEYMPHERRLLASLERSGRYGPYDKHYVRKDGSRVPVRLNGVALEIDGQLHVWSIVEDITVQRTAEAAMVDAVAAAEAASRSKSDFLANMSHEIRTPMNAILGMLQLLRRTGLDARQGDYAGKTETAARTLLAILNDILDFSKIEAGRQTLEEHAFALDDVLRDIGVILGGNVGDRDIEIVYDIDDAVPPVLIGDALRLQQVLINLAGNAVKFTQVGEVVLTVRSVSRDATTLTLAFEVRDTGIGIDASKLDSIFEGFSQAEASTTRRFGGTGLGLAISQRLVRLMGGTLSVESERGRGSRFHFMLPFTLPDADADADDTQPAPARPRAAMGALRALVVDDNESARLTVADMIAALGWTVETADSGEAALAMLDGSQVPYDVVFLDWRMPGLDGWDTSQRIRSGHLASSAPMVIMVTAHGRELLVERSISETSALDGFLMKPVTASMLVDAVADARAGRGIGVADLTVAASAAPHVPRLEGLRVLVVDDNVNNQQVVDELLQAEGANVTVAGGGAQALSILVEQREPVDVVLMDIQMPDMDGYTATRRIRALPSLARLPIVAMTANVLPSDRAACLEAGMNDHVGKPFDLDTLVARLLHWSGRAVAAADTITTASTAPPTAVSADAFHGGAMAVSVAATSATPRPVLDSDAAIARFSGNRGIYLSALQRFVDGTDAMVDAMAADLEAGRRDDAARGLHTLKGLAGTIGATRLAHVTATMERAVDAGGDAADALVPLRRALAETIAAAVPVLASLTQDRPAPPHRDAATVTALSPAPPLPADALAQLAALLAASNLQALDAFDALQPALAACDADSHRAMVVALDTLDFAAALAACRMFQTPDGEPV